MRNESHNSAGAGGGSQLERASRYARRPLSGSNYENSSIQPLRLS